MTVICIKDGIIAVDSLAVSSTGSILSTKTRKIGRSKDGAVGACAGEVGLITEFLNWFEATEHRDARIAATFARDGEQVTAAWIESSGEVWRIGMARRPFPSTAPFLAVGIAFEMALGAMATGASAEKAVRICAANHGHIGGDILVMTPGVVR